MFLKASGDDEGPLLYSLYYEQEQTPRHNGDNSEASLDLAFNDEILEDVEAQYKTVIDDEAEQTFFMKFADRQDVTDEDEAGENY